MSPDDNYQERKFSKLEIVASCYDRSRYMRLDKVSEAFSLIRSHLAENRQFALVSVWRDDQDDATDRETSIQLAGNLRKLVARS
jgi:hypothetical protein